MKTAVEQQSKFAWFCVFARGVVLTLLLTMCPVSSAMADVVVIASARSGIQTLSHDEVVSIFFGRFRQLPSGLPVQPVDLPAFLPEKASFYRQLVNKELSEINAYWSRLIFSGRIAPPMQARSIEELLDIVSNNPGAIGYIDRSRIDARVKLVFDPGQGR